MSKLSPRLSLVEEMLGTGNVICDVGTDHAYLPIALIQNNKFTRAIAMDINKGPLELANKNVSQNALEDKVELRLSDGLAELSVGEADALSICGMGGNVMMHIFNEGEVVIRSISNVIVQPQSEYLGFRKYLLENNYVIVDENIVFDEGKYYFVWQVISSLAPSIIGEKEDVKNLTIDNYKCEFDFKYGIILQKKKDKTFIEFIEKQIEILANVYDNMKSNSPNNPKLKALQDEIHYLEYCQNK